MLRIPVPELFKQILSVEMISKRVVKSVTMEILNHEMDVVLPVKKKDDHLVEAVAEVDDEGVEEIMMTTTMNRKKSIIVHRVSRSSKER